MKYVKYDKSYYVDKLNQGMLCITFIKKNGILRTMLCTSSELVLGMYGCISRASMKDYNNTLSVVDIIIDRPSFITFNRVLSVEYISFSDLMSRGETYGYNLYEDMLKQFDGVDVNDIIVANL